MKNLQDLFEELKNSFESGDYNPAEMLEILEEMEYELYKYEYCL